MKKRLGRNQRPSRIPRRGIAAMEVMIATFLVMTFTMGMYVLGERGFARLYHFVSTMIGSPYL